MNYLAHIFLSGKDRKIQLGNFVGDAVKGTSYKDYPAAIREGILLHRAMDEFTDNHPAVKAAVQSLKPHFGRYSAVLLDIYFDYLLASRFDHFSNVSLKRFARGFYWAMILHRRYLPGRFRRFMWHFISTDRLSKYATQEGIHRSIEIMVLVGRIRISLEQEAIEYLSEHENELWAVFLPFFTELQTFCNDYLQKLDVEIEESPDSAE